VTDGESDGDAKGARPLHGGCIADGANRQRRNSHQMIRAKTMEKAQNEG